LLWIDELSDIPPEQLERAFRHTMRTHTFNNMPQVGEIRAQIDQANAKGLELKAEEAWQWALTYCTRCFHPDMGVSRSAPELPAKISHAIKAAGGMLQLYNDTPEQLVWAKKRFIEDFVLIHETGQVENLLTDAQAKHFLRQITTGGPQQNERRLADQRTDESTPKPQPTEAEMNQVTETARRKIFGAPLCVKSDAEYEEEARRQTAALVARGWLTESQAAERAPGQNP
jgi:hypothetical protein